MQAISARYHIQSDGTIADGTIGDGHNEDNFVILEMTSANTLMVQDMCIKELSMEKVLKGILTAQTYFMSQFIIPQFSSELETKDASGVIERFSNMPGRSITRVVENLKEKESALGLSGKILSDAAGIASAAAMTAAEAASIAKSN